MALHYCLKYKDFYDNVFKEFEKQVHEKKYKRVDYAIWKKFSNAPRTDNIFIYVDIYDPMDGIVLSIRSRNKVFVTQHLPCDDDSLGICVKNSGWTMSKYHHSQAFEIKGIDLYGLWEEYLKASKLEDTWERDFVPKDLKAIDQIIFDGYYTLRFLSSTCDIYPIGDFPYYHHDSFGEFLRMKRTNNVDIFEKEYEDVTASNILSNATDNTIDTIHFDDTNTNAICISNSDIDWITSQSAYWTTDTPLQTSFYDIDSSIGLSNYGTTAQSHKNNNNTKENNKMKTFNFDFGPCSKNDNLRLSVYGLAIKNKDNTYVAYDIVDVDVFSFDGNKFLYKMPVPINAIMRGDVILHNGTPMFVIDIVKNDIEVIDPINGERKIILLTKSPFGFDYATKIVNLIGNMNCASQDNPFGNMWMFMMMNEGNTDMLLPLMLCQNGATIDPMMMMCLMSDKQDNLPLRYMMMNNNKPHTCTSNCGQTDKK